MSAAISVFLLPLVDVLVEEFSVNHTLNVHHNACIQLWTYADLNKKGELLLWFVNKKREWKTLNVFET